MTVALVASLAGALALAVLQYVRLSRARRLLVESQCRVRTLEAELAAAQQAPPAPPVGSAERTVRRVVRTVGTLRERGVSGLVQASIDDLMAWAAEEREEVADIATEDGRVTLFFSDIQNSTALNDRLGDDGWLRVLEAHDELVRGRVAGYGGQVVKTAGDGFMVAFGDPESACRAALSVQKHLRRPADPRLWRTPIRVRIGVHTGQAIARDGDFFGRNVAIAARVADQAEGGEVLATSAVRDALADLSTLELVATRRVELKGLPGEHELFRVRRADRLTAAR